MTLVRLDPPHPDTLARKRAILEPLLGRLPQNITYSGVDLRGRGVPEVLASIGLVPEERVFIVWEGVTHYIGGEAVDAVLRAIAAGVAPGSRLAFTYLHAGLLDGSVRFAMADRPQARVAAAGEPWIWGMYPDRLGAFLRERGFALREDTGADEYRARYWGKRGRRMPGFSFYRAALAEVGSPD